MLMGIDIGKMLGDAVKGVSDFVSQTGQEITRAIDQNGDGVLDFADIQTVSDRIHTAQVEAQRKADRERLKPLFQEDCEKTDFSLPKVLRVDEIDKDHAENEVCKGSIGHASVLQDLTLLTIYRNHIDSFGLSFYPELDNSVYYADPCDRDHYISLDRYFLFMKQQRVAELQRIAQLLGAKHFRITYKERSKCIVSSSVDAGIAVKTEQVKADIKGSLDAHNASLTTINIEAENTFPGHAPVKPDLHYLNKEINIINLIEMRMDPLSPLQHQRFTIEMSNSSGMRMKDAIKIDAALNALKLTGNTTLVADVQNEERRILEYEIDF